MKNKKGWIRIVEAFIASLLVASILFAIIIKNDSAKADLSSRIYQRESFILQNIEVNNTLRNFILDATGLPLSWDDSGFPENIKKEISLESQNYFTCKAKICNIDDKCEVDVGVDKDIYVRSVAIFANLEKYNPRKITLSCWVE